MIGVQPYFGPDDTDGSGLLAGILQTAAPLIEWTGVATAAAEWELQGSRGSVRPPNSAACVG